MEKIDYGFYDSIDNTATRWLAWNLQEHKKIGFTCINASNVKDLWLMHMAQNLYVYSETLMYIKTPFFDYLWLRFIKKFKFLRYYRKRKHEDVFLIDAVAFTEEVTKACNTTTDVIEKIYDTYYRR